jgi:hypothetical protein
MQGSAGFVSSRRESLVKNGSEQGYGMAEQNAYQVADWNGQSAERWIAYQARLDAMMAVFGQGSDRSRRARHGRTRAGRRLRRGGV